MEFDVSLFGNTGFFLIKSIKNTYLELLKFQLYHNQLDI